MNRVTVNALMEQAISTYPTMAAALLSAMRTHQRNDEPARAGTTPARCTATNPQGWSPSP